MTDILAPFEKYIQASCAKHGVEPRLVRALMMHESGGNPFAIGDGGNALGLCQIHPSACLDLGVSWTTLKTAIASKNTDLAAKFGIEYGVAYLAMMIKRFNDVKWALAAYNRGPTVIALGKSYAEAVLALEAKQ